MSEAAALNFGDRFLSGNASGTPRTAVGGRALLNGVAMRSRTGFAVARRIGSDLQVVQVPFQGIAERGFLARVPFLRVALVMADALAFGALAKQLSFGRKLESLPHGTAAALRDRAVRRDLALVALLALLGGVVVPHALATSAMNSFLHTHLNELDYPLRTAALGAWFRYGTVALALAIAALFPRWRRLFQYHGAEHRAMHVFEESREPTIPRAQSKSTYHPRCGLTLLGMTMLVSWPLRCWFLWLLSSQVSGASTWSMPVRFAAGCATQFLAVALSLAISLELMKPLLRTRHRWLSAWFFAPGRGLQRVAALPCTDPQVECGIVALCAAVAIPPDAKEPALHRGVVLPEIDAPRDTARPAPPRAAAAREASA